MKELTVATRLMQSASNELSTSLADCVKCEQMKVDTYAVNSQADVESHTVKQGKSSAWRKVRLVSIPACITSRV